MGAATDGQEIVRLGKEYAELKPVVDAVQALQRTRDEGPELEEMASGGDPEMAAISGSPPDAISSSSGASSRARCRVWTASTTGFSSACSLPRRTISWPSLAAPMRASISRKRSST